MKLATGFKVRPFDHTVTILTLGEMLLISGCFLQGLGGQPGTGCKVQRLSRLPRPDGLRGRRLPSHRRRPHRPNLQTPAVADLRRCGETFPKIEQGSQFIGGRQFQ